MDRLKELKQLDRIEYKQREKEILSQEIGWLPYIFLIIIEVSRQIYVNSIIDLSILFKDITWSISYLQISGIIKFFIMSLLIATLIIDIRRHFKIKKQLTNLYFEYFDIEIKARKKNG